jgi:hypothetical protein
MSKVFTIVFQVIAVVLQLWSALGSVVPPKYQPLAAGIIGCIQAIQGVIAHYFNPDGTVAAVAYVVPK